MGTMATLTSTLPSRRLETPMVVSLEDTPMLMLRASCSMLTMLLMPLDSVSLTPDCLLPLLRTPLRLLRPVLPTLPLLRLPRLIGRSVVLMLTPPSFPVTLVKCPPPLPLCTMLLLSAPMLVCPPPTIELDILELDILELDTSELDTFTKERMQNCTDCMYFVMNIVGIS